MQAKITRDGAKNVVVMAWGVVENFLASQVLIHPSDVHSEKIKLDQVQFSIEKDVKIRLSWSEDGVILPLEGRGLLNYYQFDSLQPSSNNQSLKVSAEGSGYFHLVIDMTKQG